MFSIESCFYGSILYVVWKIRLENLIESLARIDGTGGAGVSKSLLLFKKWDTRSLRDLLLELLDCLDLLLAFLVTHQIHGL